MNFHDETTDSTSGNAFKEESPNTKKSVLKRKENECSVTHTLHTLQGNQEKREPRSIRLRPTAYNFISNYARLSKMVVGDVVEQACFFYIDYYPVDGNVFIVENVVENGKSLKDRMLNHNCVTELKDALHKIRLTTKQGIPLHIKQRESLVKVFDKCYKIENPSDELSDLIEEALSYVE